MMENSSLNENRPATDHHQSVSPESAAPPEFGLVDVIEAFTAMRHEWRGQTVESRQVAGAVEAAASSIEQLESRLRSYLEDNTSDESRDLVKTLIEIDHQLTRAIEAVAQSEFHLEKQQVSVAKSCEREFSGMNALARWFARPLLLVVQNELKTENAETAGPAIQGLNLVLARLRRSLKEHQIERLDTVGKPFDETTMNAIGTMENSAQPSGHVGEQLAPGYLWRGQIVRYADVRVAAGNG